jgi:hypothetical protein
VSITEVYSAFPEKDGYDYSDPKTDPRGKKGDIRLAARALRREATDLLAQEIGISAEARPKEVIEGMASLRSSADPAINARINVVKGADVRHQGLQGLDKAVE